MTTAKKINPSRANRFAFQLFSGLSGFVALLPGMPLAEANVDNWFFGSDTWSRSLQLNYRGIGNLGTSTATTVPTAGFPPEGQYLEFQFGLWWSHFFEFHAQTLHSTSAPVGYWGVGGGGRLNLLEFSKANAHEFASENTLGMHTIETHRGLFASVFRSVVFHVDADYVLYLFPTSASPNYQPKLTSFQWGPGVQWGPNIKIPGLSRWYLDTSVYLARLSGASYLIPYAGLGINF